MSKKCGLGQPGYNGTACGCGRSSERTVVMVCVSYVFCSVGKADRCERH
ncbi:Uncharacterized protein PPKH_4226 [Pseudomonas putida]|nr:Uncharacterized protein PPKH_4226 [Pseudomonas putida]